jgi:hypothetical protein
MFLENNFVFVFSQVPNAKEDECRVQFQWQPRQQSISLHGLDVHMDSYARQQPPEEFEKFWFANFCSYHGSISDMVGIIYMLGRDAYMNTYQQYDITCYHLLLVIWWVIHATMFTERSSESKNPGSF